MRPKETILLTGATGGIGMISARALKQRGYNLLLTGRKEDQLKQLCNELGENTSYIVADITDEAARQKLLHACMENGVNILINNAGINSFSLFENMSKQEINQLFQVNLIAQIQLIHTLLPHLRQQKNPQIVNVGSTLGSIGFPGYSVYCSTKFAVRGFTEALGRELADEKIQIKYFAPRATNTEINSANVRNMNKELGSKTDNPETVAVALVNYLKSNESVCFLGWPEKLFVKINGILPNIVGQSLTKQLPIIKRYAGVENAR